MSGTPRVKNGGGGGKPKYSSSSYISKRPVSGPGLWVTCVRGMEKRAVPEILALLDDVADRIYTPERLAALELLRPVKEPYVDPIESEDATSAVEVADDNTMDTEMGEPMAVEEEEEDLDESIEASIARELAQLKAARPARKDWNDRNGRDAAKDSGPKQPKVKTIRRRFESIEVKIECVVFIAFQWPYDPLEITERIVMELQATGQLRTKYTNRLSPVLGSCSSLALDPVQKMSTKMIEEVFTQWAIDNNSSHVTYQIDPIVRLHTGAFTRTNLIELLGSAVRNLSLPPSPSSPFPTRPIITTSADLTSPNLVIVPVCQKNLFGMSIVQGKLWSGSLGRKFNLDAIAKEVRDRRLLAEGGENLTRVGAVLEAKREDGSMEVDMAMRN